MYCIRKYRRANGQIPFDEWIISLKDVKVTARLLKRLDKVQLGNLGDWNSVEKDIRKAKQYWREYKEGY